MALPRCEARLACAAAVVQASSSASAVLVTSSMRSSRLRKDSFHLSAPPFLRPAALRRSRSTPCASLSPLTLFTQRSQHTAPSQPRSLNLRFATLYSSSMSLSAAPAASSFAKKSGKAMNRARESASSGEAARKNDRVPTPQKTICQVDTVPVCVGHLSALKNWCYLEKPAKRQQVTVRGEFRPFP